MRALPHREDEAKKAFDAFDAFDVVDGHSLATKWNHGDLIR